MMSLKIGPPCAWYQYERTVGGVPFGSNEPTTAEIRSPDQDWWIQLRPAGSDSYSLMSIFACVLEVRSWRSFLACSISAGSSVLRLEIPRRISAMPIDSR